MSQLYIFLCLWSCFIWLSTQKPILDSEVNQDSLDRLRNASQSMIVHGYRSENSRIQFFVRVLKSRHLEQDEGHCAGTLIVSNWILTSAQCVYGATSSDLIIEVGNFIEEASSVNHLTPVDRVIWHHAYRAGYAPLNNIALLRLTVRQPVANVLPICVHDARCEILAACGMGTIRAEGGFVEPPTLVEAKFFEDRSPPLFRRCREDNICTIAQFQLSNICEGDEGGPLFAYMSDQETPRCLYGVASHYRNMPLSNRRCNGGSVFTRVQYFRQWIANTIEGNFVF